jgi:hypothetical protein
VITLDVCVLHLVRNTFRLPVGRLEHDGPKTCVRSIPLRPSRRQGAPGQVHSRLEYKYSAVFSCGRILKQVHAVLGYIRDPPGIYSTNAVDPYMPGSTKPTMLAGISPTSRSR